MSRQRVAAAGSIALALLLAAWLILMAAGIHIDWPQ